MLREYESVKENFKPVNLLRYEVLEALNNGEKIDKRLVNSLKEKIRKKETQHFAHLGNELIEGLKNYPVKSKDIFTNWKNPFRIFYSFFYRGETKKQIYSYLEEIGNDIIRQLQLKDKNINIVDFKGAQNFGSTECWIAIYPKEKIRHTKAYQWFLRVTHNSIEAGMFPGEDLKDPTARDTLSVNNYNDALDKLKEVKEKTINKNNTLINYWKYAPGESARYWDEMYKKGIMAIGWDHLGDLSNKTDEEILEILNPDNPKHSNKLYNIKNFRDASIGDVVIANKGKQICMGIGVIEGEYYFDYTRNFFKNVRKVNWLITEKVDFEKNMFSPDTFSPTKKWTEIKERYSEISDTYKKILKNIDRGKVPENQIKTDEYDSESQNFWWLNANPKIWSIDDFAFGETQDYTTHNEKGNKRRIYKYFTEVTEGDLVIGYESTPSKQVKAIFQIQEGIHEDEKGVEKITFKLIEKVHDPITWDELRENPELKESEVIINNQGSLFKLNPNEFEIIKDLIDEKNIIIEQKKKKQTITPYTYKKDPDRPFINPNEIESIKTALKLKKNIVLQGPPGTGKTFLAKKIAYDMMGKKDDTKIEMIQFHQSYSYEDFIQGIRPVGNEFKVKNGVFYNFCKKADRDKDNSYFFVIDEINRGNLSKIFGELMMLIESDKRGEKYSIPLTYSESQDERFSVPENLYIIGTMNTADRSLAIVDYALRRRFEFITIEPQFNDAFKAFLLEKNISEDIADGVIDLLKALNQKISIDKNLGKGFQIGHSYFCNDEIDGSNFIKRYKHIIQYEIVPLLEEYWFDNMEKVQKEKDHLLSV